MLRTELEATNIVFSCDFNRFTPNFKQPYIFILLHILPEANSLHPKMDGWNTSASFLLGWPTFRCYVSFREAINSAKNHQTFAASVAPVWLFVWSWLLPLPCRQHETHDVDTSPGIAFIQRCPFVECREGNRVKVPKSQTYVHPKPCCFSPSAMYCNRKNVFDSCKTNTRFSKPPTNL